MRVTYEPWMTHLLKMPADIKRYKKNPFHSDMVVPVKSSRVQLSTIGKDNNILINQATGESQGTAVTTYRKVDSTQFVKLFTANIGFILELTSPGIKAFGVLFWAVQNQALTKDEVTLDVFTLADFFASDPTVKEFSKATFKRGLLELTKAKIVARTVRQGRYFINPNFMFNGDRIAFTTLIERDDEHNEDQTEMEV